MIRFLLRALFDEISKGRPRPSDHAIPLASWYRKGAEQGNAARQHSMGVIYENGKGIAQDYGEAVKWYRKAAEQGNADAQHNLGVMYENGKGVPQDYAEAINWYSKARDIVAEKMAAEDI